MSISSSRSHLDVQPVEFADIAPLMDFDAQRKLLVAVPMAPRKRCWTGPGIN